MPLSKTQNKTKTRIYIIYIYIYIYFLTFYYGKQLKHSNVIIQHNVRKTNLRRYKK